MKQFKIVKSGVCDICGEHSTRLIDGICPKPVCQRYLEEGKRKKGEKND